MTDPRSRSIAEVDPAFAPDVDAVFQGWEAIRTTWEPFDAYVRTMARDNRRLGGPEIRAFVSEFEETLRRSGMNVVAARIDGTVSGNMADGAAYEIVAARPDHFVHTHRTFSLSSIHLFASRGRVWLRTYENPLLWRIDHVPERVLLRAGEELDDPTLLVARRIFQAAPMIAAAREACRSLRNPTFYIPFGTGMLACNFRSVRGVDPRETGTVILDYGRNGSFFNAYSRAFRADEAMVDADDPYAFAMARTFLGQDQKDYWWEQMRRRLDGVERGFENSSKAALASMFRPFSMIDPVPRFRPDPALVAAIRDVYADPNFRHHFRRSWQQDMPGGPDADDPRSPAPMQRAC